MPYREKGKWRAVVRWHGKRHQAKFDTKREAVKWEGEKRVELKKRKGSPGSMDLMTFSTKYLEYSKRFDDKTYSEKRLLCRRIMTEWASDLPIDRVTPDMILSYLDKQADQISTNAYNKDRKNLLAMWHWGQDFLDLPGNPITKIKRRSHDRGAQYVPPVEDILRLLAVATREERVFLLSYIHTGARKSEIFRWTWHDDINLERRMYRLGTHKTKDGSMEYEWFPMPDDLYEELSWWWQNRPIKDAPYVFVSTSNRYYGRHFTSRRQFMSGLCKRAGVKPFGFNALRKFFASVLADSKKTSVKTIQRLLRHKSYHTTERYIKFLNYDLKASLEIIGESLKKVPLENTPTQQKTPD